MRLRIALQIALAVSLIIAPAAIPARGQVAVLTVAAAGVATAEVLKLLEEKISAMIGRAAEAASLTADAAGRNLLLAVQAARQDLNRDLDTQWDRLEGAKLQLVKDLDRYADQLDKDIGKVERIEEYSVLDVEGLIDKLPFTSKAYSIKRVEGASQIFRDVGFYRLIIRSNGLDFAGKAAEFRLGDKLLRPETITQDRQYEMKLTIPADELKDAFQDRGLSYIDLGMRFEVPNRSFWEFWRDATRMAPFTIRIQLFPKYPVIYSLHENTQTDVVDRSKVEWALSQDTVVGGCGKDGCYSRHNIFAYIPTGGEATGVVKECTDTFSGWGSFIKDDVSTIRTPFGEFKLPQENYCTQGSTSVPAIAWTPSLVTMVYLQHSHDRTRNVQYKAAYHPLGKQTAVTDVQLQPVGPSPLAANGDIAGAAKMAELTLAPIEVSARLTPVNITAGPAAKNLLAAAFSEVPRETSTTILRLPGNDAKRGFLRYGQTYEAQLSNSMVGYTLALTSFNGDNIVVSESKIDPRVDVQVTNMTSFKRILVTPKVPW